MLRCTGMAGAETSRTWAGTGTVTATSSEHDTERTYTYTSTTTYANVVVPASGTVRWPTSGTATTSLQLEATGGPDDGEEATARALSMATALDPRVRDVPSTKGSL